jgi:hypothetical protein
MRQVSGFSGNIKESMDLQPSKIEATTIDEMRIKCTEILRREVTNLMMESAKGKLSTQSSTSLVNYVKLLQELKDIEDEELKRLSDEHLKKLAGK